MAIWGFCLIELNNLIHYIFFTELIAKIILMINVRHTDDLRSMRFVKLYDSTRDDQSAWFKKKEKEKGEREGWEREKREARKKNKESKGSKRISREDTLNEKRYTSAFSPSSTQAWIASSSRNV